MAKKTDKVDFDLDEAISKIVDWDWKVEAFRRYISNLGIEIKSAKELEKHYNDFYGGK